MNPLIPIDYLLMLTLAVGALALYLNWRGTAGRASVPRFVLLSLRTAFIALLFVMALNPGHWKERMTEHSEAWVLLLDRSASMNVADAGNATRYERAREWLQEAESRIEATGASLYRFTYGPEFAAVSGDWPEEPLEHTEGSRLADSLERVWSRIPDSVQVRGALVAGDGREIPESDPSEAIARARAAGSPVHTFAVGGDIEVPDLEIQARPRRVTVFADQEPVIRGQIRATGLGPVRPTVELVDSRGDAVASTRIPLDGDEDVSVSFELPALEPGFYEYRLHTPAHPDEIRLSNNEASLGLVVLEGDLNVLLVEGIPNWDTKFIVQLLRESAHVRLTTVHRVTAERFFRVAAEEAGLTEENSAVFPASLDELNQFDLVLFGKGVEYFIDDDRADLLRRYVSERGGALVFTRGKPWQGEHEGLERLQPVEWGEMLPRTLRWMPTAHGESAGLFGQGLPGYDDPLWEKTPSLSGIRRVEGVAPFAQVLVEGRDEPGREPTPVLAARRVGQGMVVALNAEGLWEWDFFPQAEETSEFYRDFWAQLIQWTSTYAEFLPGQHYAVRLNPSTARSGEAVRLFLAERESARDDSPAPVIAVMRENDEVTRLRPSPVTRGTYRWHGFLELDDPGLYRIEVHNDEEEGARGSAHLEILPQPAETDNLSADPAFLRSVAAASGGIAREGDTPFRIDGDTTRDDPSTLAEDGDATWETRWDRAWLLLALVGLVGTEWAVRRRLGML